MVRAVILARRVRKGNLARWDVREIRALLVLPVQEASREFRDRQGHGGQPARRVLREFKARWGILGFRVRKALKVQLG